MTTVIRGQHTAHLSRESVTSTVATIALDKSIVEVVRDNDGLIEPTRLQELGTKTKGLATTIYNALYQVQIYNEDLYKVIQKTYNKNLSFKPLQTTTTAYQPIFMTKELPIPKETPVAPTPSTTTVDNNEFDLVRNTNVLKESLPTVLSSPLFNVDNQNVHSPMIITSSIVEPSHQSVFDNVQPTPNIKTSPYNSPQFTTDSSSTSRSGPIRISSSVVRKPYNPRYTYPISRSKLRMRVSSRTSLLHPEISSSISDLELSSPTAAVSISSTSVFEPSTTAQEQQVTTQQETSTKLTSSIATEPLSSTSTSTDSSTTVGDTTELHSARPNLFRSKVIYRPRPKQTLSNGQAPNSKMIRISSRLIRPGASGLVESSPELSPTPVFTSPVLTSTSMSPESTVLTATKVIYLN